MYQVSTKFGFRWRGGGGEPSCCDRLASMEPMMRRTRRDLYVLGPGKDCGMLDEVELRLRRRENYDGRKRRHLLSPELSSVTVNWIVYVPDTFGLGSS